jgi:hypothetical protein
MVIPFRQTATTHALAVLRRDPIALTDAQIDLLAETGLGRTARAARERAQLAIVAVQVQAAEFADNLAQIERG